jgi:hypothetical protein
MNQEKRFELLRDPRYITIIELLDRNSDYVMPGAYPKHIYDNAVEEIRVVLNRAYQEYGQEAYNDLLIGFDLPDIDWLDKNT